MRESQKLNNQADLRADAVRRIKRYPQYGRIGRPEVDKHTTAIRALERELGRQYRLLEG